MKSTMFENKTIMFKNVILTLLLLLTTVAAQSQEKKSKNANYDIAVGGNCDLCKKRIEKAAFSVKGVKSAEYHLDDNILHVILNEEKCSVLDVKKAVAKVGHDAGEVKATDEDYENLHGCCHYERK
ncbi:heavy-metal-associated domain-containing protein [Flavobacterium sp.]|uniref:heavy-metal-associated domain-containing protein n=1 Tax=Flavobacterium sp. TaxID=239 RepID=UPI0026295354|nr:heavy-metal-associated domain-containing protein [Flavobacterium sp.]